MEKTFTILKPDTVKAGNMGAIITQLEKEGFRIRAMKMLHLTEEQAQGFYHVHKERPFFGSLVKFMSEGPIVPMVLEADNAIEKLRKVMGATDPAKAEAGTIRKKFGTNIERNAIHGSDAPETAAFEIAYFFSRLEIV
ncbi:MAG TPA: nucleoside-diphosphate kinase [Terriglobia bacterium]|nr:nucleoside-diphosphate kinase [Terriglobia bacterium]